INGLARKFEQRIVKTVEIGDKVMVLLNSDDFKDGDELVGRNIVAVNKEGEIDWRIEYHGFKVRNRKDVEVPQAFFGLWLEDDGRTLRAGVPVADFVVDPENGMFRSVELTQR
ncbi:MAG: hypothetical protein MJE12_28895, partial [Alphaproteobacteria bacterium]|nr:hypothetical protein [Alphaproteobacteria bacterium]